MLAYGIHTDYEPTGENGRCDIRACAYPGKGFKIYDQMRGMSEYRTYCWFHFIIGSCPFSLEYEHADALIGSFGHKHRNFYPDAGVAAACIVDKRTGRQWMFEKVAKRIHSQVQIKERQKLSRPEVSVWKPTEQVERWTGETHGLEAVYNLLGPEGRFGETFRMLATVYTCCAEKVPKAALAPLGDLPTCHICRRIVEARKPVPAQPRPRIITQPKEKDIPMTFEEMVAYGVVGFDPAAFANRRNWGERRGGQWADPSVGVQKHMQKHSQSYGQKTGTNKRTKASSR